MEGVAHDGGDRKMSLVVLRSAAVAILEETDSILEKGELLAVD